MSTEPYSDVLAAHSVNAVLPRWHEDAAITRQHSTEGPPGTTVYIGAAPPDHSALPRLR